MVRDDSDFCFYFFMLEIDDFRHSMLATVFTVDYESLMNSR